jgi:hypothetical protein
VHVFTIIDTFFGFIFVHRGARCERREKQIKGWLRQENQKNISGLFISDITSACSAISAVRLL